MRWAFFLLACVVAGCASLDSQTDWWSVLAVPDGDAATLRSTSHVNHGKPPREAPLEPRLLHEVARGKVSIALHHDAALAAGWSGSAWKFRRELDKALDWLKRLAGPDGARIELTLVGAEPLPMPSTAPGLGASDSRIVPGPTPAARNSSSLSCRCVVLAG